MKILITFSFLLSSFTLFSQNKPKIFFIRNTELGALTKFKVFIDDTIVCKLAAGRQSIHEVSEGRHTFMAQVVGTTAKEGTKQEAITIQCEPGKTYYLNLVIQEKILGKNLFCEEVTENTWKKIYSNLHVQENCKVD